MPSLLAWSRDPFAAPCPIALPAAPYEIAAALAPTLGARGYAADNPPANLARAAQDLLTEVLTNLPRSPIVVLETASARYAAAAQHAHPSRRDHYRRMQAKAVAELSTQRALGDPLDGPRVALIIAAGDLDDAGHAAAFVDALVRYLG